MKIVILTDKEFEGLEQFIGKRRNRLFEDEMKAKQEIINQIRKEREDAEHECSCLNSLKGKLENEIERLRGTIRLNANIISQWKEPRKRVVWVRKNCGSYQRCSKDGKLIPAEYLSLETYRDIYADLATVRVWGEPTPDPRPLNSITDGDYSIGTDFTPEGITILAFRHKGDVWEIIDEHHVKKPVNP